MVLVSHPDDMAHSFCTGQPGMVFIGIDQAPLERSRREPWR
jgi:hypothetical protein